MASLNELIALIDQGIDTNFAASLAGLSLAAAAFFAPAAKSILDEENPKILKLEEKIEKAKEMGILGETELQKEHDRLQKSVNGVLNAQKALLKAFIIFVWFVVYSITIDQILNRETSTSLVRLVTSLESGVSIQILDQFVGLALLGWAGKNLWKGATGIGEYFKINFNDEAAEVVRIKGLFSGGIKSLKD